MATPTSMTNDLGQRSPSGVILGLAPSTGVPFRIELQRSTQSSTASTNWTSIFLDPTSSNLRYSALLPPSTRTFYFRARHYGLGYGNGSFTPTVNAKPALLPQVFQPIMPQRNSVGNIEVIGGDMWMSSAKRIKVGAQQTTGTLTRTLRIPFGEATPASTATRLIMGTNAGLVPSGGSLTWSAFAPSVLPFGVKVTTVRARLNRISTGDISKVQFYRISAGASPTLLATCDSTHTTGWKTVSKTTLNETISTANTYVIFISLKNAGGAFLWADWVYTAGNLSTQNY